MSDEHKVELKKLDLKKIKLQIELESKKNVKYIVIFGIVIFCIFLIRFLTTR